MLMSAWQKSIGFLLWAPWTETFKDASFILIILNHYTSAGYQLTCLPVECSGFCHNLPSLLFFLYRLLWDMLPASKSEYACINENVLSWLEKTLNISSMLLSIHWTCEKGWAHYHNLFYSYFMLRPNYSWFCVVLISNTHLTYSTLQKATVRKTLPWHQR